MVASTSATKVVEVLHAWAVAPTAVGTCCVMADRGRARATEIAASTLMTIAMLDAAVFGVVASVWWTAILVGAALVQAVWLRTRTRSVEGRRSRPSTMSLHAGIGLVAMAALFVLMTSEPGSVGMGHHAPGSLQALVILVAAGYGGASLLLARRGAVLERMQYLAMGASTSLMALAAIL